MTELKPELIIYEQPFKIMNWFSNDEHWKDEVGALCVGECKNGNIHIKELLFPKQEVTMASVAFTPEGWATLVEEADEQKIQNIIGYWHKHPSGTTLSGHDETETVDVFMTKEAKRKVFCFLISAWKSYDKEMEVEGRIEIRGDINASIEADVTTELDDSVGDLCKEIIKKKITKPDYGNVPTPIRAEHPTVITTNKALLTEQDDISLDEYSIQDLGLEVIKEKDEYTIKCGEAFFENYYNELVKARQNGMLKALFMKPYNNGEYVITLQTNEGCNKKIKRLFNEVQTAFKEEREIKEKELIHDYNTGFTRTDTSKTIPVGYDWD